MKKISICLSAFFITGQISAHELKLDTVVVEGRDINLVGDAVSASEGIVGQTEINIRPLARTGEVLELIPGMVVTQHSGSGKANQYFLRGFNLDHGTDFATFVDGMPINMRSHGHGQGYTDLNFLISETIQTLSYKKGAYYADIGDFSGAGGVHIDTTKHLENNLASLTLGENGFQRALVMADAQILNGQSVLAVEQQHYDGPWHDIEENIGKTNLFLNYTQALSEGQMTITLMGYENTWNSADQIPKRAVDQSIIDNLGSIDDTVGGQSNRYSLSMQAKKGQWNASAYLIHYDLDLWSNFTYFLDDETNGDQFQQVDDRKIYGGQIDYTFSSFIAASPMSNRFGWQFRVDDIDEVGLYHTQERQVLDVTRSDEIKQSSMSVFWENQIEWNHHFRTIVGARYDSLKFDVNDLVGVNRFAVDLSENSGNSDDDLISLKGSFIYTFNNNWEAYLSAGQGFHSNDARGTTISVDPASGSAAEPVDPLVRSNGYELGFRGFVGNHFSMSAALWALELDSELLFVGDAGNTEASRPSQRSGIELVTYYRFTDQFSVDLEYAYTDAKFRDNAPEGNYVPGAVSDVLQAGLNLDMSAWFGSLRYRYFGERPLVEDASIKSDSTASVNLRVGYQRPRWQATIDVLNLTDSHDHDIDYYYESRLFNEPSGVASEDIHYHPIEPRTVRIAAQYKW